MKDVTVTGPKDAEAKVKDLETWGDVGAWKLICKASSKAGRWMKSTKAMKVHDGVVIQVTTKEGDQIAEALTFVPNTDIREYSNGHGIIERREIVSYLDEEEHRRKKKLGLGNKKDAKKDTP